MARDGDPPPPYYCERNAIADQPRNCPICLAANTNIATPDGEMNVRDIRVGTRVWSVDESGTKVVSTIVQISHTLVPVSHLVVHLVLSDSRQVWASPNHPTISGISIGQLRAGDAYDEAWVSSVELVPYSADATYDILPDSATGQYWANGILLESTLE